jgi:hypothetical protein
VTRVEPSHVPSYATVRPRDATRSHPFVADKATGRRVGKGHFRVVLSGTKGFVAVCLLLLIDRQLLKLGTSV